MHGTTVKKSKCTVQPWKSQNARYNREKVKIHDTTVKKSKCTVQPWKSHNARYNREKVKMHGTTVKKLKCTVQPWKSHNARYNREKSKCTVQPWKKIKIQEMVIYACPGYADGCAAVSVLKTVIAQNVHLQN
jgi:predicted GNAT superfamily acetyltransferase